VSASAVKYYKTRWGTKVSGSEILFIPIMDAASATTHGATPSILLRVTEDQVDAAKAGNKINFRAVEGIRTTSMDLEGKARQRLVETYGQAAVERMVILSYHGGIGMGAALGKLGGGVVMVGAVVGGFILSRKSDQPTVRVASSLPPPLPR
jgi:hypothetical protein